MKAALPLFLLTILVTLVGCQSPYCHSNPIVGDSMSLWTRFCSGDRCGCSDYGTANCIADCGFGPNSSACGTSCGGTCTGTACGTGTCNTGHGNAFTNRGVLAPLVTKASGPVGCAGGYCDGRCGGRCQMAWQRAKMMQAHAAAMLAQNPHFGKVKRAIANHCESGHCSAVPGPEYGAVTYPYYTTRGPRDFLMANPPSIGP